jgi:hypothetical protein
VPPFQKEPTATTSLAPMHVESIVDRHYDGAKRIHYLKLPLSTYLRKKN